MPDKSWTFLGRREVTDERIFTLNHDRYRIEPEGRERDFIVLASRDWVNVIPLTREKDVVLVRQYRHGVREVTLEIPGGLVELGEDPAAAAAREMREETGYGGGRIVPLGRVWPNPAIQDNTCHLYLALDVEPQGAPEPDANERIEVVTRPLAEIPRLVREGAIGHSLVVLAFGFAGILEAPPELR